MSEPTCQWCGAGVNTVCRNDAGETVLYLFRCQTSQWAVGPWHIGNECKERCAEQMRRLRMLRADDLDTTRYATITSQAGLSKAITAALRAFIDSVTERI